MAQRTVIELTDDLDGKPIPDGKGETIRFSLDQQEYEIDLAAKNAKALREALDRYVSAARRTRLSSSPRRASGAADKIPASRIGYKDGNSLLDLIPKSLSAISPLKEPGIKRKWAKPALALPRD